jgi:hypothetical protein
MLGPLRGPWTWSWRVLCRGAAGAVIVCLCAGLLATRGSGQTGPGDGTLCDKEPTGLIEKRWRELDSQFGPLGCATGGARRGREGNGTLMPFRNGEIATSPKQGKDMVVAVYQQHDDLIASWGNTTGYAKFIVRWDRDGVNVGQADVDKRYVDKHRGFFSIDSPLPGRYTVRVGGCQKVPETSDCKRSFTAPVIAEYKLPEIPSYGGHCQLQPAGFIGERWARIGGPNESIGCPTGPEQAIANKNARTMPFEHGEIVTSPDQGEGMALAVYQLDDDAGTRRLVADWGDTTPRSYDHFIVRWQRAGAKGAGRIGVPGGRRGHWERAVSAGSYSVSVAGCNRSGCKQGFTVPARVTIRTDPVKRPAPVDRPDGIRFPLRDFAPPRWQTPRTAEEAVTLKPKRAALAAAYVACSEELDDVFKHEDSFVNTAIAKLYAANERDLLNQWGTAGLPRCPRSRFDLISEVSDAIRRQEVKSKAGTDSKFPCKRTGEYDVALKGYITLIYRFWLSLAPDVRYRLLHLLNKRGPHDPTDGVACQLGVANVPETENHILLIESSRYLTNQLWFKRTGDRRYNNKANHVGGIGQGGLPGALPVPSMDRYLLRTLQGFLKDDFIEYNSRPYQRYSFAAIQNLADYAENPKVKVAARMVLDYVSAKVAVSTADARRSPPYRRRLNYNDQDLFAIPHSDPLKWRFLLFTAPTLAMHELDQRYIIPLEVAREMVSAAATRYAPPKPVLDLMVNPGHRSFYQRFRHHGAEVYSSEPDFLITAGGVPALTAYTVRGFGKADDIGVVQPTFLMPTGQFRRLDQMISFPARANPRGMCVAPGFACGFNVTVPDLYRRAPVPNTPEPCWISSGGTTFIDFASRQCKDPAHREFGFYAVVVTVVAPDRRRFGFFEAVPKGKLGGASLNEFASLTGQRNAGRTYGPKQENQYTAWGGNTIRFDIRAPNPILSTGIPALDALPKKFNSWPLVSGSVLNSEKARPAVIRITNPATGETLTLDFGDYFNPKRSG